MNLEDLDLDLDTQIDPDNLDVALVELPNLLAKYSELSTEAEKNLREADEKVKTVRSRLILYANENPEEIEGGKSTAQAVEAFYRTHEDYLEAKNDWIRAEYEASMVKNAVYAVYAKRQAIEQLIKLLSMDYFSGPSVPGNLSEKVEEFRGKVGSSLNSRKKKEEARDAPSPRKKKTSSKRSKVRSKKVSRR